MSVRVPRCDRSSSPARIRCPASFAGSGRRLWSLARLERSPGSARTQFGPVPYWTSTGIGALAGMVETPSRPFWGAGLCAAPCSSGRPLASICMRKERAATTRREDTPEASAIRNRPLLTGSCLLGPICSESSGILSICEVYLCSAGVSIGGQCRLDSPCRALPGSAQTFSAGNH